SDAVAFVENVTRMAPGEGLRAAAARGHAEFRIYVPDPEQGTVGIMTIMDRQTPDGTAPALLAVRLEIKDGKITEAEHLVADVPPEADPASLQAPRPGLVAQVPDGERMPRAALAAIAA